MVLLPLLMVLKDKLDCEEKKLTEAATGGVLLEKGDLKHFSKFTEHLRQSLFFNKVASLSLQL